MSATNYYREQVYTMRFPVQNGRTSGMIFGLENTNLDITIALQVGDVKRKQMRVKDKLRFMCRILFTDSEPSRIEKEKERRETFMSSEIETSYAYE